MHEHSSFLGVLLIEVNSSQAQVVHHVMQPELDREHEGTVALAVPKLVQSTSTLICHHLDDWYLRSSDGNEDR